MTEPTTPGELERLVAFLTGDSTAHKTGGVCFNKDDCQTFAEAITSLQSRAQTAQQALEGMRGFVRVALEHAKKMKGAHKMVGPRETHDDDRLNKLWARWTYAHGKDLWDALKPARQALGDPQ